MGPTTTEQYEYVGYNIQVNVILQPGESLCSVVIVCPDKRVAKFVETVDPVYRDIDREEPPKEEEQFVFWLMNRSRSRAMAAIALDRLEQIDRQKYVFDPEDVAPSRSDNDIQLVILRSLRRLRRLDPQHLGYVPLGASGVCRLERIRKDEFDFNEQRLRDRGWTQAHSIGWDEHLYNVRITELGLQELEELEIKEQPTPPLGPTRIDSPEYFVAHEFSRDQVDDLRQAIAVALEGSGLSPYYADVELRQGHIFIDKILPKIQMSRFGIYEISNSAKPNVFLELGAAIALSRPYVIIVRQGQSVPADLSGLDRIEYGSLRDLTGQLKDKVQPYVGNEA